MADFRSAYFGLTGKYPTDVQEDTAENYAQELSTSPYRRLGALAGWLSGANIAAGAPGFRFGSLRDPLESVYMTFGGKALRRALGLQRELPVPTGPRGPKIDLPPELLEEIGGGFEQLRRGPLYQRTARALQGRNPVGSADVPSWDVVASTESPGGRR